MCKGGENKKGATNKFIAPLNNNIPNFNSITVQLNFIAVKVCFIVIKKLYFIKKFDIILFSNTFAMN